MKRLTCLAALALAACSSPADIAGDYSVSVTNETNGCSFMNFTVGAQSTGVTVTITQSGGDATANVTGLNAIGLDVVLGTHMFSGTVAGDSVNLNAIGTIQNTSGSCTYTYNGVIAATADPGANSVSGTLTYTGASNNPSGCTGTTIVGCMTSQNFNGTRPPP
jgi:hypothetical protein